MHYRTQIDAAAKDKLTKLLHKKKLELQASVNFKTSDSFRHLIRIIHILH